MAHTRKHRREQRLSGETKKTKLKVTPKKGTKIFGVDVTKGGLAGGLNRARKKLKGASKEDLTLFKKKDKVKKTATMTGKERAQAMARKRIAAKKAGTYKAPKTAQQLAKERIAKKKKK